MKGSFKIAVIFGIPVNVHWSFLLIFVYIYLMGRLSPAASAVTVEYMTLILMLFVCVLLHEFGHALTARRYGVSTHDIILSPIGGIARLSKLPEKPLQEFMVAIAGPVVNLLIALVLAPLYYLLIPYNDRIALVNNFVHSDGNYFAPDLSFGGFLIVGLFWLNIVLAIFNLLPAFPMDGGRVLRAALSVRLKRIEATRYASWIGKAFAILFVILGVINQPMNLLYVFIGLFVFMTASNEMRMVRVDQLMKTHRVGDLVRGRRFRLYQDSLIAEAIERVKAGEQYNFLVYDHWENPVGVLEEGQVIQAAKAKTPQLRVGDLDLASPSMTLHESVDLNTTYQAVGGSPHGFAIVYNDKAQVIGLIDRILLNQYLRRKVKEKALPRK